MSWSDVCDENAWTVLNIGEMMTGMEGSVDDIRWERRRILAARVWVRAAELNGLPIPEDRAELAARPLPNHPEGPPTRKKIRAARIIVRIDEMNGRESDPDVVAMAELPLPDLAAHDS